MQGFRRDWLVALALFLSLFLVVGAGFETTGAFFSPLLKEFGWSRTRLSLLSSALYGFGGLSTPLAGWLLDRIGARIVMIVSAMLTVAGLVLASQSNSFAPIFAAYLALGVAAVGGMFLPAAYVVTNQFSERRGLVMGLVMAGSALGGMAMNPLVGLMLPILGWRDTYRVLTLPILVIALPAILTQVQSHPSTEIKASGAPAAPGLSGLDLARALRTRSFWLIALFALCYSMGAVASLVHVVPYLIGQGYAIAMATAIQGLILGFAGLGKPIVGWIADRLDSRWAAALSLLTLAFGFLAIIGARQIALLWLSVPLVGLALGSPGIVLPLMTAWCFGLKRFGTISGMLGLATTLGIAAGPVVTGAIFDATHSYHAAFALFVVLELIATAAAVACRPLEAARLVLQPAAALT
jgi:MFS family permease